MTQAAVWAEAVLLLPQQQAEEVSDALMELGALSVSLEDANADSEDEQPLFGEPGMEPQTKAWKLSRVLALFQDKPRGQEAISQLDESALMQAEISWRNVAEQDWVRLTQSQFDPIQITPQLWIVPSWHTPKNDENIISLRLDPGLAFGTGSHPTTRLCLQWLSQADTCNKRVLDYGCGSGILAIAAMKLGAAQAVGIDIDQQAVTSAQANAIANQVALLTGLPKAPCSQGTFPIVVANILSNPLKVLAPTLTAHVQAGGFLVLSGVLERQAEEVIEAYRPWMPMSVWKAEEGWVCLAGQRPE
jgi:ribosomal protein L11 methyltransferase